MSRSGWLGVPEGNERLLGLPGTRPPLKFLPGKGWKVKVPGKDRLVKLMGFSRSLALIGNVLVVTVTGDALGTGVAEGRWGRRVVTCAKEGRMWSSSSVSILPGKVWLSGACMGGSASQEICSPRILKPVLVVDSSVRKRMYISSSSNSK